MDLDALDITSAESKANYQEIKDYVHLNEVDDTANRRMELLTLQMQERQGVNEALKARDQMAWVGACNNIRNAAEEIVLIEIVYA